MMLITHHKVVSDLKALLDLLLDTLKLAGPAEQDAGPSLTRVVLFSPESHGPLDVAPALLRQPLALLRIPRLVLAHLEAQSRQTPQDLQR